MEIETKFAFREIITPVDRPTVVVSYVGKARLLREYMDIIKGERIARVSNSPSISVNHSVA